MKKTKRIAALVLSLVMILTCVPNFVEKADALEFIDEVNFSSDNQYGTVEVGDTYFNFSFGGSINYRVEGHASKSGDFDLYSDAMLETKPTNGAVKGGTYYTRLAIVPDEGYEITTETDIYLGDLKYGPTHPCYVADPVSYDEVHGVYIIVKVKCVEDVALIPTLKLPALSPTLTPNDYMNFVYDDEVSLLWLQPNGEGTQDDVDASSKITSIEFYNDWKCSIDEKVDSNQRLEYKDYFVKVGFKISEIEDYFTEEKLFDGYGTSGFDKILYINNFAYSWDYDNNRCEQVSVLMHNSNDSVVTSSCYPTVSYDFSHDEASVVFFVDSSFPRINSVEVTNATEHEMDITFKGANMPYEFYASLIVENTNEVISYDYYTYPCFEVNDTKTIGTFHLEIDQQDNQYLHDIKPNETFRLVMEGDYYDEDGECHNVMIQKQITPIVQRSSAKKYKANDSNNNVEKISGTGKKGSKRTITPIEGKKVSNVIVKDKNGNKVEVTKNDDGTYSFIQPASDVTVEVVYKNREITLTIGSTNADVDGEKSNLDVAPKVVNDRTMLPIRFVAENLGAKVEWDEKHPELVVITKGDIKIEITLGSDIAKVNGKEFTLDSVAFAENDRTYLPVRFVSEHLNAIVEWNESKPMEVKIYER